MNYKIFTILILLLGSAIFAQRQTIEYGVNYFEHGVMSSGYVPWKPAIVYDFGGTTYYLEKLEVGFDADENNLGWRVSQFGTTTPTLTTIGTLSGTFNCIADAWTTITINNGTPITGKVAFVVETASNNIYNDFDANAANGDWQYYNPDGQWYHNSDYGGGANAIKATVNTENPTPVELISFSGKVIEGKVLLSWKTATEVNNYGFEIERNIPVYDNETGGVIIKNKVKFDKWELIGFVNGYGNSNSTKEYSFVDGKAFGNAYVYRLKQIDTDGTFEYSNLITLNLKSPSKLALDQNYPNPFNPATKLNFEIAQNGFTNLTIYNILGAEIKTLVNEYLEKGIYSYIFNAGDLPAGTYIYSLKSGNNTITKKMNLIK
jgi:hypothetical protein